MEGLPHFRGQAAVNYVENFAQKAMTAFAGKFFKQALKDAWNQPFSPARTLANRHGFEEEFSDPDDSGPESEEESDETMADQMRALPQPVGAREGSSVLRTLSRTRVFTSRSGRLFRVPSVLPERRGTRRHVMVNARRSKYSGKYRHGVKSGRRMYPKSGGRFVAGKHRTSGFYGRYTGPKAEKKFKDIELGSTALTLAGAVLSTSVLLGLRQGTKETERIGRVVKLTNVSLKGHLVHSAQTNITAAGMIVRIIMFLDKQANGAVATPALILSQGTDKWMQFRNLENSKRFQILSDKTYDMNAQAGGLSSVPAEETAPVMKHIRINKNWPAGLPINFAGDVGDITDLKSNNVGIMVIASQAAGTIQWQLRSRFTDS